MQQITDSTASVDSTWKKVVRLSEMFYDTGSSLRELGILLQTRGKC